MEKEDQSNTDPVEQLPGKGVGEQSFIQKVSEAAPVKTKGSLTHRTDPQLRQASNLVESFVETVTFLVR